MPRPKKKAATGRRVARNNVKIAHSISSQPLVGRLQKELQSNQSYLNLVLGLLIVLAIGVLIFNYFKRNSATLGPAQQTTIEQQNQSNSSTPPSVGKYTVKEGDTLFKIAQAYYNDGYKYPELVKANNIADESVISVGQELVIPKLDSTQAKSANGTGGATNQTIWGERITGDTYTVVEGDWLSKIAGRAYGDIYAFDRLAKANNIADPNLIEPGTVLKIPR